MQHLNLVLMFVYSDSRYKLAFQGHCSTTSTKGHKWWSWDEPNSDQTDGWNTFYDHFHIKLPIWRRKCISPGQMPKRTRLPYIFYCTSDNMNIYSIAHNSNIYLSPEYIAFFIIGNKSLLWHDMRYYTITLTVWDLIARIHHK